MPHIDCCYGKEADILCKKCGHVYCEICFENHICRKAILKLELSFDNGLGEFYYSLNKDGNFTYGTCDKNFVCKVAALCNTFKPDLK